MMNLFLQLRYNQTPVDEEGSSGSSGERCSNGNAYLDVDDASKRQRDGFDGEKGEDGDVVVGGGKLGKSMNEGYDRTKGDTVSTNMEPTKFQPESASKFGTFTEKEDRGAKTVVDKTGQQERKSTMREGIATPTYFCTRTGVRFGRDIGEKQPESPSRSRTRNSTSTSTSTSPISQSSKRELKVATPGTTKRKRASTKEEEKPQSSRAIRRVSSANAITAASNPGVPKSQPPHSNNTIIPNQHQHQHQQRKNLKQEHHITTINKSSMLPTTTTATLANLHPAERRILEHAADILSEKSGSHVTLDQLLSITQQTFFTSPNNHSVPSNLEEVSRPVLGNGLVDPDSIVVVRDRNKDMYPSPPSSHRDFLVGGREEGMEGGGSVGREEGVKRVKKVKRRKTAGDCSISAMLMG